MKTASEIIDKVGKKKFIEMAVHGQKGQTGAQLQRRRRWGKGKTSFQICQHSRVTIRDGKPTNECKSCATETGVTKMRDFEPNFNIGLGCWVESKSDIKRVAKSLGLTEAA